MIAKRILIIDDEEDIREVAQLTLEAVGGWLVFTAESGFEGLQVAEAEKPDAILLDVMMPEMDGIATFGKLQANPATQNIPVILLTAKVQSTDQRRFAELGVTGMIAKPFNPMTLSDQLTEALGWY
ncbi:two-component response regulator [Scytonema sp. HK-05]|uniref:response regulator n=1 Tax=Scytonema sp. HK-05 TaxID=1137095 RepID=UPI0009374020|nr:response regulator [Scytonema sp. HK-05]OKH54868.1 two-component system response regulator [Scytonema sp. HK-05]BAY46859.1 two-component response regulator [Scytonema sp. HK-05]